MCVWVGVGVGVCVRLSVCEGSCTYISWGSWKLIKLRKCQRSCFSPSCSPLSLSLSSPAFSSASSAPLLIPPPSFHPSFVLPSHHIASFCYLLLPFVSFHFVPFRFVTFGGSHFWVCVQSRLLAASVGNCSALHVCVCSTYVPPHWLYPTAWRRTRRRVYLFAILHFFQVFTNQKAAAELQL